MVHPHSHIHAYIRITIILNHKIRFYVKAPKVFPRHSLNFAFALFIFVGIVFSFLLGYNIHTGKYVKSTNFKVQFN